MAVAGTRTMNRTGRTDRTDNSVGELVKQATEQLSDLVRQEIRLAQAELAQKGRRAGRGGGLLGGAAVFAFVGFEAGVATAIVAIAQVLRPWAAALIITAALLLVAGVLALVGRRQFGHAAPAAPERAIASVKADVQAIKERAHR
jgi:VIT1/CCC1 family predicted Fe2+/Mn2+ transporter